MEIENDFMVKFTKLNNLTISIIICIDTVCYKLCISHFINARQQRHKKRRYFSRTCATFTLYKSALTD